MQPQEPEVAFVRSVDDGGMTRSKSYRDKSRSDSGKQCIGSYRDQIQDALVGTIVPVILYLDCLGGIHG